MNREIGWYIGFITGAASCGLLFKYGLIEVDGLLRLVIIIGVGVGCGWLCDTIVKKNR